MRGGGGKRIRAVGCSSSPPLRDSGRGLAPTIPSLLPGSLHGLPIPNCPVARQSFPIGLTLGPYRYSFYTVEFEFDPDKSRSNKQKHGIDFQAAQLLWDDPELLQIPARTTDEPRFLVIGRIARKHWSAIITYRQDSVRIISVRSSRHEEVELYEST
jgi:uncharacterized protein